MASVYDSALTSPPRQQWESSSGTYWASQSNNCGPTCQCKVADLYKNTKFPIEGTRRLAAACCKGTTPGEQRNMLQARGVPANVLEINSLAQLRTIVGTAGRRPVTIGVKDSRVPANYRGHPFLGWHAIVVLASGVKDGVSGFYIMDPNFSPPGGVRPDPMRGKRFYPDWVLQYAYINYAPRFAIVPSSPKSVSTPTPPVLASLADGDPYPMRYRNLITEVGSVPSYRLRAGKPIRRGPSVSSGIWSNVPSEKRVFPFGYVSKADMPVAEQGYGDVFMINWYQTNGHHVGYIKAVDLA